MAIRRRWDTVEDDQLRELRKAGWSYERIGAALGRTANACVNRYSVLSGSRKWDGKDERRLLDLVENGKGYKAIAFDLERTVSACKRKHYELKNRIQEEKEETNQDILQQDLKSIQDSLETIVDRLDTLIAIWEK